MGANIVTVTDSNFDAQVLQSGTPVVLDFWAEWCGPCKMIAPILDELAGEYSGKITIGKVNIDEYQELAGRFRINSIPTLLFFKGGQVVDQVVGMRSKKDFKAKIDQMIG
jgi:thioredoxin 1